MVTNAKPPPPKVTPPSSASREDGYGIDDQTAPVDETDDSADLAPGDIGEGEDNPGTTVGGDRRGRV